MAPARSGAGAERRFDNAFDYIHYRDIDYRFRARRLRMTRVSVRESTVFLGRGAAVCGSGDDALMLVPIVLVAFVGDLRLENRAAKAHGVADSGGRGADSDDLQLHPPRHRVRFCVPRDRPAHLLQRPGRALASRRPHVVPRHQHTSRHFACTRLITGAHLTVMIDRALPASRIPPV